MEKAAATVCEWRSVEDSRAPVHCLIAGSFTAELQLRQWVVVRELIGLSYVVFLSKT